MEVYSGTDRGIVRSSNQDYCKTGSLPDGSVWAVVCDGMGGANGGSTASRIAAETIAQQLKELYNIKKYHDDIEELIKEAIAIANQRVHDMSVNVYSLSGMGTTVVAVLMRDEVAHIVHAGDSRAYLYENGSVRQITKDHSMVQELVDLGRITPEEARNHPNKNIITRALGTRGNLRTDYNKVPFGKESVLLICTDGLSNYLTEEDIAGFISENKGMDLVEKLIEQAKSMGGSDNITVAVIESGKGL